MQPSAPYVSICIPTLSGWDNLIPLLESIKKYTPQDHEVIIIDSANRSRGYTVPMNQALRAARGEILVPLNDDIEVVEGWLDPLIEAIEKGNPVVFPDIEPGEFCICGWFFAMSREWFDFWGGFDERFILWCTEIDLAHELLKQDVEAVRVKVDKAVIHKGSKTSENHPELKTELDQWAQRDLIAYHEKWHSDAPSDKTKLGSGRTYNND